MVRVGISTPVSFQTDRDRRKGTEMGDDILCSLSDVDDQPEWTIGRGESAFDKVLHVAAILVAAKPADKHTRRARL
jgi:hypothetical protein